MNRMKIGAIVLSGMMLTANAGTTAWTVNPGTGFWDVASNWNNGVPISTNDALINQNRDALITVRSNAVTSALKTYFNNKTINLNSGVTLDAGATYIGMNTGSNNVLNVAGTYNNSGETYIGYATSAKSASINVSGGSYVGTGALRAGYGSGSEGRFTLNSGSASFNAIYVGIQNATASGAVEVNGGTLTAGNTYIGYTSGTAGSFKMTDGTANLGVFRAGFFASNLTADFLMTGGTLNATDFWLGSQNQTGESVTAAMSGGTINLTNNFVLAVDDAVTGVDFDFSGGEIYASGITVYNLSSNTQDRVSFSGNAIMYLAGNDTNIVKSYNTQGFMIADANNDGIDDGTLQWGYDSGLDRTWVSVIPEPATIGMMGFAGLAILIIRRNFRR